MNIFFLCYPTSSRFCCTRALVSSSPSLPNHLANNATYHWSLIAYWCIHFLLPCSSLSFLSSLSHDSTLAQLYSTMSLSTLLAQQGEHPVFLFFLYHAKTKHHPSLPHSVSPCLLQRSHANKQTHLHPHQLTTTLSSSFSFILPPFPQ